MVKPPGTAYTQYVSPAMSLAAGAYTVTVEGQCTAGDCSALIDSIAIDGALLSGGGFEAPSVPGSYVYNPAATGWTFTGRAGVQANGSAWGGAAAPQGNQTAFIQGNAGSAVAKVVTVSAGNHVLSFYAAQRPIHNIAPQVFRVRLQPAGNLPPPPHSGVRSDFNRDGKPDLTWQNNATGQRAIWMMNGSVWAHESFLPVIPREWEIAVTADFTGDGQTDIVWQNKLTGQRAVWVMDGTTWVGERFLPVVPVQWQIVATGDFNGDGQSDLVWQHTGTGQRAIWLMNGSTFAGERFLPTIATDWKIAAAADFDRDGHTDIVWQNSTTGQRAIWLMNGTSWAGERWLPTIAPAWQIAAAADFNADGHADLVWQNTHTGQRAIWVMNGSTWTGERFLPQVPTEWEIRNR
jgi:hypothetical protein